MRGKVVVPEVLLPLSSHRVLTMEFIDGVKVCGAHLLAACLLTKYQVTDIKALREMGIAPHAVAQLVSQTFNEMIFTHGDVHCDPHAVRLCC